MSVPTPPGESSLLRAIGVLGLAAGIVLEQGALRRAP
jgi:hypothetical protein